MGSKTAGFFEATRFHPDEGRRGPRGHAIAEEDKEGRNRGSHEFNDGNHDRFPTGRGSLASGGMDGGEEDKQHRAEENTANGGNEQSWRETRDEVMPAVEE